MTAGDIAHTLRGRKIPTGWMAPCPAHDDRNPSLSLKDADDGKILVHCHAGCEQETVIAALKARDLWPTPQSKQRSTIVAEYDYCDETGQLLYQVVRIEPKGFFQRRPDGFGKWINEKGKRQVLFHLREVLQAPIVFVVEGEKDVETLRSHGFVATTNAGGAKAQWLSDYTAALHGREVILIPDNDPPGRQRVLAIARALLGHATRNVILELEDGKDVTEWFARGHGELELIAQVESQQGTP